MIMITLPPTPQLMYENQFKISYYTLLLLLQIILGTYIVYTINL